MIKFDLNTFVDKFITEAEFKEYEDKQAKAQGCLSISKDMMGWYDLEKLSDQTLVANINKTAEEVRNNCDVFLVIGIGGSYLGAVAVIEALSPYFYNNKKKPEIYFLGTSFSSDYIRDLIEMVKDKNIIVNVISKSGTTLETTITYNLIMDLMVTKYNEEELKKRIIMTTDEDKGELRKEANRQGCKTFTMPDNIGGRYSVLSPVGLLPIAVAGIDIKELLGGARGALTDFKNVYRYAAIRDIMYKRGKVVEAFVAYEPKLNSLLEWLKQLYSESLGKEDKGILPISLINVRDLHSMGQFLQEGNKIIFETVINIETTPVEIRVEKFNKTLNDINQIALKATATAHQTGGVLSNVISISELREYNIGYLMQFFMVACAVGGSLEEVNPFDQKGVEEYKNEIGNYL